MTTLYPRTGIKSGISSIKIFTDLTTESSSLCKIGNQPLIPVQSAKLGTNVKDVKAPHAYKLLKSINTLPNSSAVACKPRIQEFRAKFKNEDYKYYVKNSLLHFNGQNKNDLNYRSDEEIKLHLLLTDQFTASHKNNSRPRFNTIASEAVLTRWRCLALLCFVRLKKHLYSFFD